MCCSHHCFFGHRLLPFHCLPHHHLLVDDTTALCVDPFDFSSCCFSDRQLSAAVLSQETIPESGQVLPGQVLVWKVRLLNDGCVPWPRGTAVSSHSVLLYPGDLEI